MEGRNDSGPPPIGHGIRASDKRALPSLPPPLSIPVRVAFIISALRLRLRLRFHSKRGSTTVFSLSLSPSFRNPPLVCTLPRVIAARSTIGFADSRQSLDFPSVFEYLGREDDRSDLIVEFSRRVIRGIMSLFLDEI